MLSFNLQTLTTSATTNDNNGSSWIIWLIFGIIIALTILIPILHDNKRKRADNVTKPNATNLSLYEALRLPGDPDPELGKPTWFINVNANKNFCTDKIDADDDDEITKEQVDPNVIFSFFDIFSSPTKKPEKKKNYYDDDEDYSYDTHCEYCGELLEDCSCDHQYESRHDLGLWGRDDDVEKYNSRGSNNNRRSGSLDFDKFRTRR